MHAHDVQSKESAKLFNSISSITNDQSIPKIATTQVQRIIHLQQTIGNQAVQRLIADGQLDIASSTKTPQHTIQRQCGCGCANCNGVHDDIEQETSASPKVQRNEDEDDNGGNWFSDAISGITGTVSDWMGNNNKDHNDLRNVPKITAGCETEEEVGHGSGEGPEIRLHGRTAADFNEGEPMPDPFPDTINVETFDAGGGQQGFNAHGTYTVTFDAQTSVTLPDMPGGLTPCQTQAVQNFINGPLTQHENQHVSAFRDNYDGEATISVNADRIADTPSNRENTMQNPLTTEHLRRRQLAVDASNALDPWNQEIPGLDCEDE